MALTSELYLKQSNVVNQYIDENPDLAANADPGLTAKLLTTSKTSIIKAANELVQGNLTLQSSLQSNVDAIVDQVGNYIDSPTLLSNMRAVRQTILEFIYFLYQNFGDYLASKKTVLDLRLADNNLFHPSNVKFVDVGIGENQFANIAEGNIIIRYNSSLPNNPPSLGIKIGGEIMGKAGVLDIRSYSTPSTPGADVAVSSLYDSDTNELVVRLKPTGFFPSNVSVSVAADTYLDIIGTPNAYSHHINVIDIVPELINRVGDELFFELRIPNAFSSDQVNEPASNFACVDNFSCNFVYNDLSEMKSAKLEFVNSRFSKKAFSNSTPLLENLLIKEGALLRKISFDIDSQDALIGETGRGVATYGSFSTVEDATSVPYDYRKLNANQPLVIYDALYVGSVGFQLEIHRDGQVGLIGRKFIQLPKMYDLEVIVGELKLAAMLPTGGNVPHPLTLSYLVPEDKLLDATFGLIAIFRADGQYPEFANVDDQSNLPVGVHGSRLTVAVRDQSANVDPNGFRKLTFNDSTSIDDGTILYNVQILDFEAITATLGGPVEIALRLFWKDRAGVTKTLDVPKLTVPKVDPIVKLTDVYIHSAYWSPNTAAFQINGFMNFYALSIVAHYRFVGDTEWKTCNVDPFARHDLTRQFSITDLFADSNIENWRAIETYITCVNAATALPYDSEIIQANMFPSYSSMRSIQYSYLLSPQPTNPNKFDFHLHILKSSTGSTMTIPYNVNATTVVYPARIRGEIFLPSNTAVIDAFRWVSFGDLSIPAFELYVDPVDSKEYYHCKISLDNSLLPKVADHLDYIYGIGFGDLTGRIFLEYDIIDQNTSETKTIVQPMETYANRFPIVRPGYPLKPGETISMVRDILYHTNDFALFIANSFVPDPTARRGISPSDLNRNRAYSGGSGSGLIGITLFRHSPFAHAGKSAKLITLHAKLNNDVDYSSFPCRLVTNGENYGQYRESAFLTDEIQYGSTELHQMEFYITFEDDNGDQYVSDVYKFIGSVGTVLTSGSKFDLGKISISDSRGNCLANEGVYEYVTEPTIPIKGGGEGGGAFPTIQPPRQITLVMGHSVDPLIAFDDTIGHI